MKEEFKLGKVRSAVYEILGWIILILFFAGIWLDQFRWKLIFTAIFLFIFMLIDYGSKEHTWSKKHDH